jgi:aldose 1-epimerase
MSSTSSTSTLLTTAAAAAAILGGGAALGYLLGAARASPADEAGGEAGGEASRGAPPARGQRTVPARFLGIHRGEQCFEWCLRNEDGTFQVKLSSLGCAVTSVIVGRRDVVLGYDDLGSALRGKQNFGTLVGRCANRIKDGKFTIDGTPTQLELNNGRNHLHGGPTGFFSRNFRLVETRSNVDAVSIKLGYHSEDGEEGYPGSVDIFFLLRVYHKGSALEMEFSAFNASKPTCLSLTNHCYWNLHGHEWGATVDGVAMHELHLPNCKQYTVAEEDGTITGEIRDVVGDDVLDFTSSFRALGPNSPLDLCYIIDMAGCIDKRGLCVAARLRTDCVMMTVLTNAPGVQVYSAGGISPDNKQWQVPGKSGVLYQKNGAICIETQNLPDAVNHPATFQEDSILRPGQAYTHTARYEFTKLTPTDLSGTIS